MNSDILLGASDDIDVTPSGDIALLYNNEAIIQRAINNIKTIYGESFIDDKRGNLAFERRLKLNDNGMRIIEQDCRNAILYDYDILEVPSIIASRNIGEYSCSINFTIKIKNGAILHGDVVILI